MRDRRIRPWVVILILVAGCALVGSGFLIRRKVHDPVDASFNLGDFGLAGLEPYRQITERDLLLDATFTGVVRKEGGLYSTYDRTATRGKRTCPS